MATVAIRNLNNRVKGDTFSSIDFDVVDAGDAPVDLTGVNVSFKFNYKCNTGMLVYNPSTTTSGVTITSAVNGAFTLDSFTPLTWEVGIYHWDMTMEFTDGTIHTYVRGTVKVIEA
tara:strand:- start:275 stop:622 length:348 start_codon:yes stop_codon:yes gene_type:complete